MAKSFEVPCQDPFRASIRFAVALFLLLGACSAALGDRMPVVPALASFLICFGIVWLIHRTTRNPPPVFRVTVTESAVSVSQRWSSAEDEFPLEQLSEIAVVQEKSLVGQVRLRIAGAGYRHTSVSGLLPPRADVDGLARFLAERLSPWGVRITRYDTRFGLRWPPRFSLATVLILLTAAAVLLGVRSLIDQCLPASRPFQLAIPVFICFQLPFVMFFSGSRTLAAGGIAYAVGACLEFRLADGCLGVGATGPPPGWCCSTAVWWRYLNPTGRESSANLLSTGLGMLTSAVLAACIAMLVSLVIGYAVRHVTACWAARGAGGGRRE